MSSSPRNGARRNTTAPETAAPLICPECSEQSLRRVRTSCTLLDGTEVANLTRYHCSSCQADLFDLAAMCEIRKHRSRKPATKREAE